MKISLDHNARSFPIELVPAGRSYRLSYEDKTVEVEILQAKDGRLELLIDGQRLTAYVSADNARRWVTVNGRTVMLTQSSGTARNRGGHAHPTGELTAPMPGQVRAVNISEGESVSRGQTLLLLEAMKMEIRIQALREGRVKKLFVKQGQTVEKDQILVEIEES